MSAELSQLLSKKRSRNEPLVPPIISRSFLFVNTAGVRDAPEILLLELFRELFFENFAPEVRQSQLDPESPHFFTKSERAVLYLTRGREKQTSRPLVNRFYAPAYPVLARNSWLRKKTDRVIRDFLLRGPLSQYFRDNGTAKLHETSELIVCALFGQRSVNDHNCQSKEVLSAAIASIKVDAAQFGLRDVAIARERLKELIEDTVSGDRDQAFTFRSDKADPLAYRLTCDLLHLCELEGILPRLQWLAVIKSYLRLALSSWLLAKMQLTIWTRNNLLIALKGETIPTEASTNMFLAARHRGLFYPTTSPTEGPGVQVEMYMRARTELSLLMYSLHAAGVLDADKLEIVATDKGNGKIGLYDLFALAYESREKVADLIDGQSISQWLLRYAERFPAWTNPRKKGQGKNFDEFLRVLARSAPGDGDDGYLVTPVKGRGPISYIVFPGPMLIKSLTYLAARAKQVGAKQMGSNSGRLVLADVESHFQQYGIEFGATAGARPKLISELLRLGMLVGSPDAGDSAAVQNPFLGAERTT